jgi:hypothetical protein
METSLHRELKRIYAGPSGRTEVRLGKFRVDAVVPRAVGRDELIEIQHGSLWAIRDKIQQLLKRHPVRVVKPIIRRKRLITCSEAGGPVVRERLSPRVGQMLELFDELVYFTQVFPHKNLTLEVALVDIEEWRLPAEPRRRSRRRGWQKHYVVEDQKLLEILDTVRVSTAADLRTLLPGSPTKSFHTGDLAKSLEIQRWVAQRIAYVLRKVGTVETIGKQRGAWLYQWSEIAAKRRRKAA